MTGYHRYFVSLAALIALSATVHLTVSADELRVSPAKHIAERVAEIQSAPLPNSASLEEPRLVRAELLTHTNDDNKDGDTGIYVTVTTKDTTSLLARIINADSSNSDATAYNDGSDHFVELVVQNSAATPSVCRGFQVTIAIRPTGGLCHDTWHFDAQVVLYFSDGSTLLAEKGDLSLSSEDGIIESRCNLPLPSTVFNAPNGG
jgi:hypothetical protein